MIYGFQMEDDESEESHLDCEFELLAPILNANFHEYHEKSLVAARNLFGSLGAEEFLKIVESHTFARLRKISPVGLDEEGNNIFHDALVAKTIDSLNAKRSWRTSQDHFLSLCPALKVMLTNGFKNHLKFLRKQGFADSMHKSIGVGYNPDSIYIIMAFFRASLDDYQNDLYVKMIRSVNSEQRNYCNIPFKTFLMLGLISTFFVYLWSIYSQNISQDRDEFQNKIAE